MKDRWMKVFKSKCENDVLTLSKNLTLFFLMFMISEIVLGNSGRWFEVGGISIRMIIFFCVLIFSLPLLLYYQKKILKNGIIRLYLIFLGVLIINFYIGWSKGYDNSAILDDIIGFFPLFLLPTVLALSYLEIRKKLIDVLIDWVIFNVLLLSSAITILFLTIPFMARIDLINLNYLFIKLSFGGISPLNVLMYRLFLRSEVYLQLGLILMAGRIITKSHSKWRDYLWISLVLFALNVTFTRSYWIGLFVSSILFLWFNKEHFYKITKALAYSIFLFSLLQIISTEIYHGFSPVEVAFDRLIYSEENPLILTELIEIDSTSIKKSSTTSMFLRVAISTTKKDPLEYEEVDEMNSTMYRSEILRKLNIEINKSLLIGQGLGKTVHLLKSQSATEYMYLDLWMKTGIIGLLSFISPLIALGILFIKRTRKGLLMVQSHYFLIALIGLIVTSYFNPYLNNPLGLTFVLLTVLVFNSEYQDSIN